MEDGGTARAGRSVQGRARTLKDLADQRRDDLLAHDAQLPVPQRVLQHLCMPY